MQVSESITNYYFCRDTLLKGLTRYCCHLMNTNNGPKHIIAIFNIMAISHILRGRVKPFDERETNLRNWKRALDNESDFFQLLQETFGNIRAQK